jgi:hypothetical protein
MTLSFIGVIALFADVRRAVRGQGRRSWSNPKA